MIELEGLHIDYPAELPISARVEDIRAALRAHQVVIVAGATGSGKTTQLPKVALEVSAARENPNPEARPKRIGITQPRRIAATSVAARVAEELGATLGREVGYQIRFEDRTHATTRLKFMTDGILLAEIQGDPLLRQYHTLIIDEAHERSLTIDFLLGWLKWILPKRADLRVIVSSATIETARFSEFFDSAPVLQVEGRTYPVDVLYEPPDPELDLAQATANAIASIAGLDPTGDILAFLPGEREIGDTERVLAAKNLRHTQVLPLFSRLTEAEQSRVFAPASARRIILATNVAETSLTLPGIVYVVDTGVARLSRYDARTGTTRLQVEGISQASADQRKGRCGRVREGICVRLYEEEQFQARPAFTDPEVRRVGLAGVILRMKALRLGDIDEFPFLDAPGGKAVAEGYRVLEELGALTKDRELTNLGKQLARFPVDPRVGRMILAGAEYGCLPEIVVLAAALEVQDPRERPRGAEQKADSAHRRFRDESSDFVSLLKLWAFVKEAQAVGSSHLRRVCKEQFLSFTRIREWREVHRQLSETVAELGLNRPQPRGSKGSAEPRAAASESRAAAAEPSAAAAEPSTAVHLALLSGLLSRIGQYQAEQRSYQGSRQTRFAIHPASALAKKPPAWVMAFELVQTTQLFARTVAKIEPDWLDQVGGHLLKRSYSEPHWSEKSARASVREHATLFGLQVLRDRSIDYATLAPGRARLIFLEHALVRGGYSSKGAFQAHNQALMGEVSRLRDKARQSDMLADADVLLGFFDRRVPDSVVNGKTFETWREQAERRTPRLLFLSLTDVLATSPELVPADYPDKLTLEGVTLPLSYCFEPGAERDGITLDIPLVLLSRLKPSQLHWTIPGWQETKILELLQNLPKPARRCLEPLPEAAATLRQMLAQADGDFLPKLTVAASELARAPIDSAWWRLDAIPRHLNFYCRVLEENGHVLGEGRDLAALMEEYAPRANTALSRIKRLSEWQRAGITRWDFGELPQSLIRQVAGLDVAVYPALRDSKQSVELCLLESPVAAERGIRAGTCRLVRLAEPRGLAHAIQGLPPPFVQQLNKPPDRAQIEAFRESVLQRVVEEAYLPKGAVLPRSRAAYEQLFEAGTARLESVARAVIQALVFARSELDPTLRMLEKAQAQPSGATAAREIREQLSHLLEPGWVERVDIGRLAHFPRYLRAAQIRIERAIVDPRKDAQKLAPFTPVWSAFLAKSLSARETETGRALRWVFEEWRVAIFAPELKPAFAVTPSTLAQAVAGLQELPH